MAKTPFPIPGFIFSANIADTTVQFQEVSGLKSTIEFKEVRSGGLNNQHFRIPIKSTYGDVTFKRGVFNTSSTNSPTSKDFITKLKSYVDFNRPAVFKAQMPNISITLKDETGKNVMTWDLVRPNLVSMELSTLNAQNNELAFETLVFNCVEIKIK